MLRGMVSTQYQHSDRSAMALSPVNSGAVAAVCNCYPYRHKAHRELGFLDLNLLSSQPRLATFSVLLEPVS